MAGIWLSLWWSAALGGLQRRFLVRDRGDRVLLREKGEIGRKKKSMNQLRVGVSDLWFRRRGRRRKRKEGGRESSVNGWFWGEFLGERSLLN
jgi:hypothetical protein